MFNSYRKYVDICIQQQNTKFQGCIFTKKRALGFWSWQNRHKWTNGEKEERKNKKELTWDHDLDQWLAQKTARNMYEIIFGEAVRSVLACGRDWPLKRYQTWLLSWMGVVRCQGPNNAHFQWCCENQRHSFVSIWSLSTNYSFFFRFCWQNCDTLDKTMVCESICAKNKKSSICENHTTVSPLKAIN